MEPTTVRSSGGAAEGTCLGDRVAVKMSDAEEGFVSGSTTPADREGETRSVQSLSDFEAAKKNPSPQPNCSLPCTSGTRKTDFDFDISDWEKFITKDEIQLCKRLQSGNFSRDKSAAKFETQGATITLYQSKRASGLNEFIAEGTIPIPAEKLFALNLDESHRQEWDDSTVEIRTIGDTGKEFSELSYTVTKYPSPFRNRDYIISRRVFFLDGAAAIFKCAVVDTRVPEVSSLVRVHDFQSISLIRPVSKSECTLQLCYYEDPRLSFPGQVVSWVCASLIPRVLGKSVEAGKKYPDTRMDDLLSGIPVLDIGLLVRGGESTGMRLMSGMDVLEEMYSTNDEGVGGRSRPL